MAVRILHPDPENSKSSTSNRRDNREGPGGGCGGAREKKVSALVSDVSSSLFCHFFYIF